MKKLILTNQSSGYMYKQLMVNFAEGKPLAPELVNFLARHEKTLSNPLMDSVLNYYLKHLHNKTTSGLSFLLRHEKLNYTDIAQLKRRLQLLVKDKKANIEFLMTPAQFSQFKYLSYRELILFHGNQFLTGAPFIQGGIPHLIYFQWGNLFGVAKYIMLPDDKALKSNVLVYFEDREEREFIQCIYQYNHKHVNEINKQQQLMPTPQPAPSPRSIYQIPTLSLSRNSQNQEKGKF
jgi:hypothetical protein